MSWTKKVTHPSEMVKKGDKLQCVVLSSTRRRSASRSGKKQLHARPVARDHPGKLPRRRPALGLRDEDHELRRVREARGGPRGPLAHQRALRHKVTNVEDVLKPGMKVEVRVIRVDTEERKIGLSFVHADFEENEKVLKEAEAQKAKEKKAAKEAKPEDDGEVKAEG
jgi:small subunit ribosomal protein S1